MLSNAFARSAVAILVPALLVAADFPARVDEYMNAHVRQGDFAGSVLVARDGAVLAARGYGMANREHRVANTPRTKFRLGSVTKQFTATAIMQLEQRGKLRLDDAIARHLSNTPGAWEKVTIHHLLSHTSGIQSYTDLPEYSKDMILPLAPDELIARFRDKPLHFQPGENWRYSNSGYFLLGRVIEKTSGLSYEEFLRRNIFDPLGMKDSGYDHYETVLEHRASGYLRQGDRVVNDRYLDMGQPYSAGALYSTVEDLRLWDQALYTERLLPKAALERMFTPVRNGYGYGWMISTINNRKVIRHGGGIPGFSTMIARYPEQKLLIVVLSNLFSSATGKIASDLAAMALGEKYEAPAERAAVRVDPKIFDVLAGRYEVTPQFSIGFRREGDRFMIQATGQPAFEVFPESETRYFLKVVDAQVDFFRDASGKVTHLVLHQGGQDVKAVKVE